MATQRKEFVSRKRKVLKIVSISILALIIIIGGFVIWYINNGVAGLFKNSAISKILGTNKQIQLEETDGTKLDINTVNEKLGYNIDEYEREDLKKHKSLSVELDSKEAAYLISELQKDEETMKNVQVEIDGEENLLLSAVVNVEKMAQAFGADTATIEASVGELPDEIPIYAQLDLSGENNSVSLEEIKLGKVKIPDFISSQLNGYVDEGVEDFFENILGIEIDDISISDGNLNIEGDFPAP